MDIDKICGILDAQGFIKDDEFYPREISLISPTLKYTQLCETHLKFSEMNVKDRKTNAFLSNNILGLSLRTKNKGIKINATHDPIQVIFNLYHLVRTDEKPFIGIKNDHIKEILDMWDIPYVNLGHYNCPNLKVLKLFYGGNVCHYHDRHVPDRRKLRCAEQKCEMLWKWLIDYYKRNRN